MSQEKNVAVLIVHWKSIPLLLRCLDSLLSQECMPSAIMVLDNGGEDPLSEEVFSRYPSVRFFKSDQNIGFAAGNNLLFRQTDSYEWIALINPDVFLEPDWLGHMLGAAKAHPEYSVFSSLLVQANQPGMIDGEGDLMHMSGLAWRKHHGQKLDLRPCEAGEVFSACAAAALYRREAFSAVGGVDEDFFCYFEDVDLGFRLRLQGHRCLFVPEAKAFHVGSASTGGHHSDFAVYHGHRNLVWTYVKNMPGLLFWLLLPLHILLNVVTVFFFVFMGKGRVILRAKRDALLGLPRMFKKRRGIQKSRKVSIAQIWRVLDKRLIPFRFGK